MKKFASLILTALMLLTVLTVFAVPAFAEDEPKEISASDLDGVYGNRIISEPGDYTVSELFVLSGSTLTIGKDVCIFVEDELYNCGTIDVQGTLVLSDCDKATSTKNLTASHGGMIIGGSVVKYTPGIAVVNSGYDHNSGSGFDPNYDSDFHSGYSAYYYTDNIYASVFSKGNLTVVVGIACSAVFFAVGFLLGRKTKKTATAGGTNKTDEE